MWTGFKLSAEQGVDAVAVGAEIGAYVASELQRKVKKRRHDFMSL